MKRMGLLLVGLTLLLGGCFRPAIPIGRRQPNYAVDVFYEDQQPNRPFVEIQWLEYKEELPVYDPALKRGKNVEEKEIMLTRLSQQAKKLGADALVAVRYQFYTSVKVNGYSMRGMAVRYLNEREVGQ